MYLEGPLLHALGVEVPPLELLRGRGGGSGGEGGDGWQGRGGGRGGGGPGRGGALLLLRLVDEGVDQAARHVLQVVPARLGGTGEGEAGELH